MGEHHHHHHHVHPTPDMQKLNRSFLIGIVLNVLFVVAEAGAGFYYDSLALLSDAGHNLSDVVSLVLALFALRLSLAKPSLQYTYGYKKSTVLVSLLNAAILFVAVAVILYESIDKLRNPAPLDGSAIAWVAAIGIVVNAFTAYLFFADKSKDLNVKGAYLHMAADALVSVGVMVSGGVMMATGWYMIDPLVGLLVAAIIVYSTWGLLRDSLRLSLDGVPAGIDYGEVLDAVASQPGVEEVHHLHVWALSTTENAMTAHIAVRDLQQMPQLKSALRARLHELGIDHATFEFEETGQPCSEHACCNLEAGSAAVKSPK